MRLIVTAMVLALWTTVALANTQHNERARAHHLYRVAAPSVVLHPNHGNPNGDPDGPTTLSGTGNSQFGGSSPGTSGYN